VNTVFKLAIPICLSGALSVGKIVLARKMDEHHAALPEPDRNRLTGCQAVEDIAVGDLRTLATELVGQIDNPVTVSTESRIDVRPGYHGIHLGPAA